MKRACTRSFLGVLTVGALLWLAAPAGAQQSSPAPGSKAPPVVDAATHAAHAAQGGAAHSAPGQPVDNTELARQLAELRAQIAELQASLAQGHAAGAIPQPMAPASMQPGMQMNPQRMGAGMGTNRMASGAMPQGGAAMPGMSGGNSSMQGMSGGGGGMGKMGTDQMKMSGMSGGGGMAGGAGMMGMMDQMMGMGMSRMGGGMNAGGMASALPGFPGASHIYHLGATGFFLDHGSHITLSVDQRKQLGMMREQSLLNQATLQRRIDQAEQELWDLTGAEAPDATKVEAKAREIEQLKTEQRIAFIRDVGKAAAVLTDEQRQQLTGMAPANPAPAPTQPGAMQGMGGANAGMSDM